MHGVIHGWELLLKTYREGCRVIPEVRIHENRVNGQTYYIAETDREADFEFKGRTLMKMWDVREERTYYPKDIDKWIRDKRSPLKEVYDAVKDALDDYIRDPYGHKDYRAWIHKRNLTALNNIRKAENELKKKALSMKRACEKEPPVIHKRGGLCPEWLWVDNPEYIVIRGKTYLISEYRTLNEARRSAVSNDKSAKIYKRAGSQYQYVGTVRYGEIGAYKMVYFMNKNGAFQMNDDGSLAGALYRW